jgi:Methyltransferase domain
LRLGALRRNFQNKVDALAAKFSLEALKPRQFFGFDSFALHKWIHRRGITGAQLFEGLTHRQYYERAMAKFGDIVVPVEGLTAQTLREYADRSFDLVYVNAGHSYAEVKADAACAVEMVSEDGFLVFDDYILINPSTYVPCGVVPVVNDLVVNQGWIVVGYPLEEYLYCDIALRRA